VRFSQNIMMFSRPSFTSLRVLALCLAVTGSLADDITGPCDIYASGDTPCVAAHSTTRALFGAYTGSLYEVTRGSDNSTVDITPLSAGGVANASAQDSFCSGTTCLISTIYDQSGYGNHLTRAPPGGAYSGPEADGYDFLSSADGAPVTLNGQKAYGVFIPPFTGYRNDKPNGTATGDDEEGMYAVLDGTHYNDQCCFDYGNGETDNIDPGAGAMEAIYFGSHKLSGWGSGPGPWVMADLEDGLFSGYDPTNSPDDVSIDFRFVTSILKGGPNQWSIRGGDSTTGTLTTYYSGIRPSGDYSPMIKEGAIVLGVGGDNSDRAQGTFYEGVMTTGYPSNDTEDAVQANIVAAKYATTSLTTGPDLPVSTNFTISLRATTACCTTKYISHDGDTVHTAVVTSSSSDADKQAASWTVRTGLANSDCFSFESVDTPGSFIRHSSYQLKVNENDDSTGFGEDATFCPQASLNSAGNNTIRSWSYPTRYWRQYNGLGYIASNGGPFNFDATDLFNDDASWVVTAGFV
jgi:hypothetical protein